MYSCYGIAIRCTPLSRGGLLLAPSEQANDILQMLQLMKFEPLSDLIKGGVL